MSRLKGNDFTQTGGACQLLFSQCDHRLTVCFVRSSPLASPPRAPCYLDEGPRSGVGAEQYAEAAGGAVLPAVGSGPDARQRAAQLSQRVRAGNVGLPQELSHVLPPPRLTLPGKENTF